MSEKLANQDDSYARLSETDAGQTDETGSNEAVQDPTLELMRSEIDIFGIEGAESRQLHVWGEE